MKFLKKIQWKPMPFPVLWIRLRYLIRKSLRFIRDGKETLHTPGDGQLKSAIYAVFGKDFTAGLIPVDYEFEHVKVWGFISKPAAKTKPQYAAFLYQWKICQKQNCYGGIGTGV
ncbi:MAG: hypothetical protein ACLVKJ_02720 [Acutalibacteraceae bacterium]